MHVCQPAARKDAQPDQKDVLDPETREPALWGRGRQEAPHEGCVSSPSQTPPSPPASGLRWGFLAHLPPHPSVHLHPGPAVCGDSHTSKYTGR